LEQIIESIVSLPTELDQVIILNIYEIAKNLPEQTLKTESKTLFSKAIPIMYINRYKNSDYGLKTLSRKAY